MMHRRTRSAAAAPEVRDCPCCEAAGTVTFSTQVERFVYGAGHDAVTLEALVPVWTCADCGDAYVGEEAEELRHEAVCTHLGRPTPREMRAFREARRLTQADFANLTGFGIASIKRWESSAQVPSASAAVSLRRAMSGRAGRPVAAPRFRTAFNPAVLRRAAAFRLGFCSAEPGAQAA